MARSKEKKTLDVAMLPLADSRQIILPLQAIAEVQQLVNQEGVSGLGDLNWRGQELPIESLDAICGLPEPSAEQLTTVAVFKAQGSSERPFRALAFSGTASHDRVDAEQLETQEEAAAVGHFLGATALHDQVYLIPDLPGMMFSEG
jgi:chemotaxis protein histidine kinase CheA